MIKRTRSMGYDNDSIQKKAIFQVWLDIRKFLRGMEFNCVTPCGPHCMNFNKCEERKLKTVRLIDDWGIKAMARIVNKKNKE